jgi:hypothetical protein
LPAKSHRGTCRRRCDAGAGRRGRCRGYRSVNEAIALRLRLCLCLCFWFCFRLHLGLCLRRRLRRLYLYLHDGFFQRSPRDLKLRLVQGWVKSTHFRNEGCGRTFVQPPTRLRRVAIECVDAFGQYWIKASHSDYLLHAATPCSPGAFLDVNRRQIRATRGSPGGIVVRWAPHVPVGNSIQPANWGESGDAGAQWSTCSDRFVVRLLS